MKSQKSQPKLTALNKMTPDFYAQWSGRHVAYQNKQWERLVWSLRELEKCGEPWPLNQLQHSLQMADRVSKAGSADELILCALCHDVGKVVGYQRHGEIAAEMLRPYVSEDNYRIVATHQDFECFHLGHLNPDLLLPRERYSGEPWYEQAIQFSLWDQASFDPDYLAPPVEEYIPLIRSLCSTPKSRISCV